MPPTCRSESRFALVDALNAEWHQLEGEPAPAGYGRAEIGRWAGRQRPLAGCVTPADVLTAIRADPDPTLGALITIHQGGAVSPPECSSGSAVDPLATRRDELAGRIILQTMLGKLVLMARRDSVHAVEDYVGQLWLRMGNYPLARRPRRVAANLALDTLKAVVRDHGCGRLGKFALVPVSSDELERAELGLQLWRAMDPPADLTARRVLRTAEQLGLIDDSTRRLLLGVYGEGLSSSAAAARYGLTPTTVRFRCSRAIRKLARHASEIAEAA
jgi:DNA-directed RNA polymerase specialized sigma24 family protein